MNSCTFHTIWPGGNTTAIVDDYPTGVPLKVLADMIMKQYSDIEQVGFRKEARELDHDFHLEMMGGEFCGNAARSIAYLHTQKTGQNKMKFMVSGFANPVEAVATDHHALIILPGNFFVRQQTDNEHVVVDLQGIRHVVVFGDRTTVPAEELVRQYAHDDVAAVGIMYITQNKDIVLDPVVYVRDTNTIVSETACGSGSIAVALALQQRAFASEYSIQQPSGVFLKVEIVTEKNTIQSITLGGEVAYKGTQTIPILERILTN